MEIVNTISWEMVRLIAIINLLLARLFYPRDNSLRNKVKFIQMVESMKYILASKPEEIPKMAREQLLMQGKTVLVIVAALITFWITKGILKI